MSELKFKIHKLIKKTNAEGPGTRLALWVQGCSRHCDGCFEKDTWSFDDGYFISLSEMLKYLTDDIDGVTVLGGEPMEQAEVLAHFLREVRIRGKNSIVFTGNKYADLKQNKSKDIKNVLCNVDLLVDGEFDISCLDKTRPMVGSTNQNFIPMSDSGQELKRQTLSEKNKVEIRITKDGVVMINGMWKGGMVNL